MVRRPLLLALVVATACSGGGRARDQAANRHPRSEFPADAPGGSLLSRERPPAPSPAPRRAPDVGAATARVVASAVARAIVTDAQRVYFGDATDDSLFAVDKAGGEPVRVARRAPVRGALALDDEQLAWIGNPGDVVLRASVVGDTPTTLRDRGIFTDLAASGGDVIFTEATSGGGALVRVTGATAARLATFDATPRGLAIDADDAFVVVGDKLVRTPRARGPMEVLAAAASMSSPVVSGEHVYVVAAALAGEHVVLRIPKTGGDPSSAARRVRAQTPIATYGGVLYVIDADRPHLRAVPLAGGAERVLAEHEALAATVAITADADGVYVATGDAGLVLAVPTGGRGPSSGERAIHPQPL